MSDFGLSDPPSDAQSDPQSMNYSIDTHVIQARSRQDHTVVLQNIVDHLGLLILFAIFTFDGHGGNRVIDFIRRMDLESVVKCEDPFAELQKKIAEDCEKDPYKHYKSGSTLVLTLVYEDHCVMQSFGDSTGLLYINETLVYKTTPHCVSDDPDERNRVLEIGATILRGNQVSVLDEKTITMVESNIVKFSNDDAFTPSCALGHGGVSEGIPKTCLIPFNKGDIVTIAQYSDGIGDMLKADGSEDCIVLNQSAEYICKLCVERWKQDWNYLTKGKLITTKIGRGNDTDDVCCAIVQFIAL